MSTGHLLLLSSDPARLLAVLENGLDSNTADALFSPAHQLAVLGPTGETLHSLIVQATACAEATCSACGAEACAGCDTGFHHNLDTGRTVCEHCEGRSLWHYLADLQAETALNLVVTGCFYCSGEEYPERSFFVCQSTQKNTVLMDSRFGASGVE